MKRAALVLFALGLLAYIGALASIGTARGETYSDVGNGLLLVSVVLLLLRREQSPSGDHAPHGASNRHDARSKQG